MYIILNLVNVYMELKAPSSLLNGGDPYRYGRISSFDGL